MINTIESLAAPVLRASWQAGLLALFVALLVWLTGERIAPRWRYLLWSVVLVRLLLVVTPASAWSIFNFVGGRQTAAAEHNFDDKPLLGADVKSRLPEVPGGQAAEPVDSQPPAAAPADGVVQSNVVRAQVTAPRTSRPADESPAAPSPARPLPIYRWLALLWFSGCIFYAIKLATSVFILRRRMLACQPVSNAMVLKLLSMASERTGLKHTPALLVSPDSISPSVAGVWKPCIIVPETLVTESSAAELRHVLAHELAHLVRGDLWTNWLLLVARVLHWFNPLAWWTVHQLQAEREAACDDLALAALGNVDRSSYANTIVDLAARLSPSPLAPGLIGFFASTDRLKKRIERLAASRPATTLATPIVAAIVIATSLAGLTDAQPAASIIQTGSAPAPPSTGKEEPKASTHTMDGRCVNEADGSPLAGVTVRLFKVEGRTSPPVEIAHTVTGVDGRYAFPDLIPPRADNHLDRLQYEVFGFADDGPIGMTFFHFREDKRIDEIRITREQSTLAGIVLDEGRRPVAGANVLQHFVDLRPVPGLPAATTDAEGRFKLDNVGVYKWPGGRTVPTNFTVQHPDHPATSGKVSALPAEVVVMLQTGCVVTGTVRDAVTGQPASGAVVTARRFDEWGETFAATDAAGRFRLVVPEGRYDFLADAKERVCIAITGRECLAGEQVDLPPLALIRGGFISGQVVNTVTGKPVSLSERGEPIMLGLVGPSQPAGRSISTMRMAAVDDTGHFTLRAAPGGNYPYFANTHGERMAWDTQKQPPVVVKDGETTTYNMLITPEIPTAEKLETARQLVAKLPQDPKERADRILAEFRKLNHTVDECELWCMLMRELVNLGPQAVPQLCAELDRTTNDRMLRRLAFALRAIGDKRAVPALIRAIPNALQPSSSDFGLIVEDAELTAFMQKHQIRQIAGGTYFDFGRPIREVFAALHRLTGQDLRDDELYSISLSSNPRRAALQRRIFEKHALLWQNWWEAHWGDFTQDAAYQFVDLPLTAANIPPARRAVLGPEARLGDDGMQGATLTPAGENGRYFLDLDTGFQPSWPVEVSKDETKQDAKGIADWAAKNGVDLMCVTQRTADGKDAFVLRAFDLEAWEIGPRDLRNLDKLLSAGNVPKDRPAGEFLMHYDAETKQYEPAAIATFVFVTREGNWGLIEITDRGVEAYGAALSGKASAPAVPGASLFKGVRFNYKSIVPQPVVK